MTVEVTALTPAIGAEISGLDLTDLSADAFELVHRTLIEHQVVFFRDQSQLAPEDQISFARRFGELHAHPAAPHMEGHPEIFVIHAHKDSKVANGNGWHTDVSCDETPPMGTMLQIHQLPLTGGDTLWTSTLAEYDALSEPMQKLLEGLTARHESEQIYRGRYSDRGVNDAGRDYPSAIHPMVRTHPDSGRRSLYVNPSFTTRIPELAADESAALLEYLYRHQQRPEFQVRFRWTPNAIALWDNRSTQHFALWDYWPEERRGHRVTIAGERPFFDPDRQPATEPPAIRRLARRL